MTSSWREVFNRGEALGLWDFGDLNGFWGKKSDECRALRKRFFSMTYSGIQCWVWLGSPWFLCSNGALDTVMTCALYSSSPLKECLYPKQLMRWLYWGFHSWLQLSCLTFCFVCFFSHLFGDVITWPKKTLGNGRWSHVHNAEHTASGIVRTVHDQ